MKKTLFMLLCLLCSIGAMAQKKTITGEVTDATGEAVIGASIVETGTTNGTVTDLDGNFTLSVANDGSIRVSFVGYQTQTLSVKGKSTFKIALKEDSEMLQEVVVTGYGGKQLRTKVTNSISKVKEETLKRLFDYHIEHGYHATVLTTTVDNPTGYGRIIRDENYQSNVRGLIPAGEGAGYAGGITSAAIDGIKIFEYIGKKFH